jgi:MFS family permease
MRNSDLGVSMFMTTLSQELNSTDGTNEGASVKSPAVAGVRRRLRPLYVAGFFLGINFWVPVEKLFLSKIGFNSASVGLLAATYAAVVPFLEIPSGILADRWSRRGVLIVADIALAVSTLVGGISTNVPMYLMAALLLGCYFALQSGTVDSIVYDVLVEEAGHSDGFVREMARLRLLESIALVSSALAGGVIAALTTPRVTYFLTIPFAVLAIFALTRFKEPSLHRSTDAEPLRSQITATYRTILEPGRLRPIVVGVVLCALMLQMLVEFGPLWMVALAAPAVLYGPQWAGLMSAMGLGGLLAGRAKISRRSHVTLMVGGMLVCSLALTISHSTILVIGAQILLVLLLVTVSTQLSQELHDAIPSNIRAGVSSGVGTLTWMMFVPAALGFGLLSRHTSVLTAGWMMVALSVAIGVSLSHLGITRQKASSDDSEPVLTRPGLLLAD